MKVLTKGHDMETDIELSAGCDQCMDDGMQQGHFQCGTSAISEAAYQAGYGPQYGDDSWHIRVPRWWYDAYADAEEHGASAVYTDAAEAAAAMLAIGGSWTDCMWIDAMTRYVHHHRSTPMTRLELLGHPGAEIRIVLAVPARTKEDKDFVIQILEMAGAVFRVQ